MGPQSSFSHKQQLKCVLLSNVFRTKQQTISIISSAITDYMFKDNVSFNAVNRSGFQHLKNVLEPR